MLWQSIFHDLFVTAMELWAHDLLLTTIHYILHFCAGMLFKRSSSHFPNLNLFNLYQFYWIWIFSFYFKISSERQHQKKKKVDANNMNTNKMLGLVLPLCPTHSLGKPGIQLKLLEDTQFPNPNQHPCLGRKVRYKQQLTVFFITTVRLLCSCSHFHF